MALSSAPAERSNLASRILSGMALAPVALLLAFAGGPAFDLAVTLAAVIGLGEWLRLVTGRSRPASYAACPAVMVAYWVAGPTAALAALGIVTVAIGGLIRSTGDRNPWLGALGAPYVGLSMISLAWLRDAALGGWPRVLFILLVIWASDIGAFAVGRALGGPRLAPRISPNKTWAGFAGAIALAGAVALAWATVGRDLAGWGPAGWGSTGLEAARPVDLVALAAFLSVVGQGGDLFESAIKRRFKVKDSGGLIPGHGGMLDRIDALLWAAPIFALINLFDVSVSSI